MDNGPKEPFSTVQLIKGLAVGVLIGAICLAIDFFLGMALASTHLLVLAPVITAGLLASIAFFSAKHSRDTGFVRGVLISLSLALIISTACGVAMGIGPLRFN